MITTMSSEQKTYSRTAEYRKICKPLVERKRRARINKSLSELKSIILDVVKKDGCQYTKLEKADILEMTVGHLHQLRRQSEQQATGLVSPLSVTTQSPSSNDEDQFHAGFVQCATDVSRFLSRQDSAAAHDSALRSRLLSHLNGCVSAIAESSPSPRLYTPPTSPVSPLAPCHELSLPTRPSYQRLTEPSSPTTKATHVPAPVSLWRPW